MPTFKDHPCPTCGTIKYRKTPEAGYACKYGHQMEGYREEQGDDEAAFGIRTTKRKRVVDLNERSKRLYGADLEDAFKRIFQYALQVMARSFVKDLGFPAEYEYVVRELWLLYIHDNKVTLMNAHNVEAPNKNTKTTTTEFNITTEEPDDLLNESDSDSDSDGKKNKNDDADATPTTSDTKPSIKENKPTIGKWPKLKYRHVIVLCYIACVYLGWPLSISDIRRWCATERLPYMQVHKQLPKQTLDVIDLRILQAMLEVPSTDQLRIDTCIYIKAYIIRCGLSLPKFNAAPLIFRYCTQLFLPVEMYFCALELYEKHPCRTIQDKGVITTGFNYHAIDTHIMLIILVLAKFLYGLDDAKNTEVQYDIPTLAPPLSRKTWMEHIRANADRWENIYRTKMIDSPEAELDFILDYLKGATSFNKGLARKENKSLARRYITRLRDDLLPPGHPSRWFNDLLTDVPRISSTIDRIKKDDDDIIALDDKVMIIGDHYFHYGQAYKAGGKLRYFKEYEMVLMLAGRILDLPFEAVHGCLVKYELSLGKNS